MTFLSAFGTKTLDMLLPPHCLRCDERVAQTGSLCASCWNQLAFISRPFCFSCGLVLSEESEKYCTICQSSPPSFDRAFAPLIYNEVSRDLIIALKHARRSEMTPLLSRFLLGSHAKTFFDQADMVTPVPLYWRKILVRGYNQATLIARFLARHYGVPLVLDVLTRIRATKSQGHLNAKERTRNLYKAFRVASPEKIKNKKIVLIDDVFTTGITVTECCKVMKKAGARHVSVVTLARVDLPRPHLSGYG